ncbi:hypothetical protein BJ912DRAFT_926128 [Pholiota molesta]|nr:hypothetical protein BJ912DRAFT_926128 [Pholiota molesta]
MATRVVPPEICGLICQNVQRRDLHSLCAVSRAFRGEAERLLYTSVKLHRKRKFRSFCLAAIRRPYLVQRLHTLVMLMPPQLDLDADELERISKMLHLATNLRHLHVLGERPPQMQPTNDEAVQVWIINGHKFKLKTFVNSYFQQHLLIYFLHTQPTIETLVMDCGDITQKRLETAIPDLKNLKRLSCSTDSMKELSELHRFPNNLEWLQLHWARLSESEELTMLTQLKAQLGRKGTLRMLSIQRYEGRPGGLQMSIFLFGLAIHLPHIRCLRVMDYSLEDEEQQDPFVTPVLHLPFTQLETLVLRPTMLRPVDNNLPKVSAYTDFRTPKGRRRVATTTMIMLPTLKRLILIIEDTIIEYRRTPDGIHVTCSLLSTEPSDLDILL